MPRIGAAHRHRDREAGRHQLWSPLRWPASTRLPSCAAAAHRPGPHGRRPSPAPRSFDGGLVSLGPTRPGHPHRPITIARVLVPRLRSIRLLSRPGPTGWPMLRTACAGPHRTLIHSAQNPHSLDVTGYVQCLLGPSRPRPCQSRRLGETPAAAGVRIAGGGLPGRVRRRRSRQASSSSTCLDAGAIGAVALTSLWRGWQDMAVPTARGPGDSTSDVLIVQ